MQSGQEICHGQGPEQGPAGQIYSIKAGLALRGNARKGKDKRNINVGKAKSGEDASEQANKRGRAADQCPAATRWELNWEN